jgi:serine/threonine protein kinase
MAPLDYQPGQQLPGTVYKILRLIGVGGMGTVYDVEDTTIGKRYVIKTLHPKHGAREDLARRVLKEARTLARLNHPNIVEVITAGVTADDLKLPYYVMERLNGQSLRLVLDKKGRLDLGHAYHIGIDLLDALDHAHDKGLIHRDVKPDNIFLHRTAAGVTVTKLLDFGIVSVLDAGTSETAGRFLGTLRYSAPEQLRGESPTPKMDVYAAALVIYEILAGRGPFDDQGDASAVGAAHLNRLAPRLSKLVPVPRELDNLLAAALAKDPILRPRDAFSFAASLRNLSRALEASQRQEATDSRATAAGVLEPAAASSPALPVPAVVVSSTLPAHPVTSGASPVATLVGMSSPTVGPASAATTTTPDALDRSARTGTIDTDVAHGPRHGTEAMEPLPVQPSPVAGGDAATLPSAPPGGGDAPIEWPAQRAPARSEEPQIRSVPVAAAPRGSRGALVAAVAGAAMLAVLGAVALVSRGSATSTGSRVAVPAPAKAPQPREPDILPAPTIAPPAFDLGELAETPSKSGPKAAGSAEGAAASAKAATSVTAPAATGTAKGQGVVKVRPVLERPGPGF